MIKKARKIDERSPLPLAPRVLKRTVTLPDYLCVPAVACGQWTTNGNNINNNNSGNVGVGTTTPGAKLDIKAGATARGGNSDVLIGAGGDSPQIELYGSSTSSAITHDNANGLVFWTNGPSWRQSMFVGNNGYVGVGTTTPAALLHVSNPTGFGALLVSGSGPLSWTCRIRLRLLMQNCSSGAQRVACFACP